MGKKSPSRLTRRRRTTPLDKHGALIGSTLGASLRDRHPEMFGPVRKLRRIASVNGLRGTTENNDGRKPRRTGEPSRRQIARAGIDR